jgi:hypothetical protein
VNSAMVHAYWLIGREIVEVDQQERSARAAVRSSWTASPGVSLPLQEGLRTAHTGRVRLFYLTFPGAPRCSPIQSRRQMNSTGVH